MYNPELARKRHSANIKTIFIQIFFLGSFNVIAGVAKNQKLFEKISGIKVSVLKMSLETNREPFKNNISLQM